MKLSLKIRKEFLVLLLGIFFSSCLTNVEEVLEEPDVCTTITFAKNVKPIIEANCVQCHNGSQFPDLRDYSKISANAASVKSAVVSRKMPLGGSLTNQEIEAISCWVENGALNN